MFAWLKRKTPHPSGSSASRIYGYFPARVFTNGGLQYTFEFKKVLPLYSAIGPATVVMMNLNTLQPPQVYNYQAVPTDGLGGLQAGALVSQPLVNNDLSPIE